MFPLVSIIIPTYNHDKFICSAVGSALSQTYKNIEIIVVDDGSTDDTSKILSTYTTKIKYIYQQNKGLSTARNTGIKVSNGEFIAFLDSDDVWLPDKIYLQIKEMLKLPSIGLVSSGGYIINENSEIVSQFIKQNYKSKKDLLNDLVVKNVISGGSLALIRKKCFEELGLFDENLRSAEDWDMWFRIAKFYDIKFVEKPLAKVRVRTDSMSAPINVEKMLLNELKFLNKVFSEESLKRKWLLKRKAYNYRYYSAAIAYRKLEKQEEVAKCILKSFCLFPFGFLNKSQLVLVLYTVFGDERFKELKRSICERRRKLLLCIQKFIKIFHFPFMKFS